MPPLYAVGFFYSTMNVDFWISALVVLAVAWVLIWEDLGFNHWLRGWLP